MRRSCACFCCWSGLRSITGALPCVCACCGGQTILMVTHSVKAASHASRVLFIKDGEVFHEIYRGESSDEQLYQKISDTLTMLATGGEHHA